MARDQEAGLVRAQDPLVQRDARQIAREGGKNLPDLAALWRRRRA